MKLPRFRIGWRMGFVALAALNFGVVRALLGPHASALGHQRDILLLLGALPMSNVLVVGMLIGQRRPGSRPFLMGFETFGAMALAFFIALASCFPREVVMPYLAAFVAPIEWFIGPGRPFIYIPIGGLVVAVTLVGPQVAFALIGGVLSRRFKVSITPR